MILCLGTTPAVQRVMTFERLTVDAVNRAVDVTEGSAGKSVNVAKVVRAQGADVTALGFAGGDTGQHVRADLERRGVTLGFIDVQTPTRTCVTLVDRAAGQTTELVEEAAAVEPPAYEQLLAALEAALDRATVLVLSGTLPAGAPQDFYAACIERANRAGVTSILDAKGDPLTHGLRACPTIIKPNLTELAQTLGTSIDTEAAARQAVRRIAAEARVWAIVTRGAQSTIISDGTETWLCHGPRIEALNPIGSGDAVAAGLAVGISRGMAIPEACRLAIACGAANALTALAGEVHASDVTRLHPQTRLQPVPQMQA